MMQVLLDGALWIVAFVIKSLKRTNNAFGEQLMTQQFHISLSEATAALKINDLEKASQLLKKFLNDPDLILQGQANNLMGVVCIRKGQNAQALSYFKKACHADTYFMYWANLASAQIREKELEAAKESINQAVTYIQNQDPEVLPEIRFLLAQVLAEENYFETALEQLNPLWESYLFYKTTDTMFLHIRKMPPFEHFLAVSIEVINHLTKQFNGTKWLQILYDGVDDEGKETITRMKAKLVNFDQAQTRGPFDIPLPTEPRFKPLIARVEDIDEGDDIKYVVCRVIQGTLNVGAKLMLKDHLGQLTPTKCLKLEFFGKNIEKIDLGRSGVIHLDNVDTKAIKAGDCLYSYEAES